MIEKEEKLTYEILHEFKKKQDRLINEGKMENPQIIYGFSPEDRKAFEEGYTIDELKNKLEQRIGKIW